MLILTLSVTRNWQGYRTWASRDQLQPLKSYTPLECFSFNFMQSMMYEVRALFTMKTKWRQVNCIMKTLFLIWVLVKVTVTCDWGLNPGDRLKELRTDFDPQLIPALPMTPLRKVACEIHKTAEFLFQNCRVT